MIRNIVSYSFTFKEIKRQFLSFCSIVITTAYRNTFNFESVILSEIYFKTPYLALYSYVAMYGFTFFSHNDSPACGKY